VWSSELSKLVSNAMLAQRISSINSISAICEQTGANIEEVSRAIGMDSRIGPHFLKSSIGFGGSCFKKDILNLVYISRLYGLNEVASYWESVVDINYYQTERFGQKIISCMSDKNSILTILGWSFKKDTNDSRESASIYLAKKILLKGYKIKIYDPMVDKNKIHDDIKSLIEKDNDEIELINDKIQIFDSPYEAFKDSNICAICTEWDEFKDLEWTEIYKSMNKPSWVCDGRNILEKTKLEKIGFKTFFIGQS
jgi:UDPglucose 6-dehydrogenase